MSPIFFRRDVDVLSRHFGFCRILAFLRSVYARHGAATMLAVVDRETDRLFLAVGDARWCSVSEKETNEPLSFFIETWWEFHAAGWRPSFEYANLGLLSTGGRAFGSSARA